MKTRSEVIQDADDAEHFVTLLDRREEELLLTALLKSLPIINAREAVAEAGYDLGEQ